METDDFARARAAVHADDLQTAARLLERGPGDCADDLEWQLYFRWVQSSTTSSAHFGHLDGAVELARRALLERRCIGFATYVVAAGAAQRGQLRAAMKLFQQASREEPSIVDARRRQRVIARQLDGAHEALPPHPLRLAAAALGVIVVAVLVIALLR